MRFEYSCSCGVTIATEEDAESVNFELLQSYHEVQVSTHIANCRKALAQYPLREVKNENE